MLVIIDAIFQIVLLLLKAYYTKEADAKAVHTDKAKQISDAVASGSVSSINATIMGMRR